MSAQPRLTPRHTPRRLLGALTAAAAVAALAVTGLAGPASATPASPTPIFTEGNNNGITGLPANAVNQGLWGHEGAAGQLATYFSLDASDGAGTVNSSTLATALAKIGPDATISNLRVAFVASSADGTAEQPTVTAGQAVGDVFTWFGDSGIGTALSGTTDDADYVTTLSTQSQYDAGFAAGQHPQVFDSNLVAHDGDLPGAPVSSAPLGKSILNLWPAGTHVSMVYYVSAGNNAQNEPTVKRNSATGKAETAWLTFTTVASHNSSKSSHYNSIRTSAGYQVSGVMTTPNVAISWSSSALKATITDNTGTTQTGATGTAQLNSSSGGTLTPVGAAVSVSNGVASFPLSELDGGTTYVVVYTPDAAASGSYATATSTPYTGTAATMSVSGKLVAGQKQTLKATVSPAIDGTVTFLDNGKKVGSANVSSGTGSAKIALAGGARKLTAQFTPAPATYLPSVSAATNVTVAKASAKVKVGVSPKKVKAGQEPKLTIQVSATGVTASGSVKVSYKAPHAKAKTITAKLKKGSATVTLPKAVKGTTSVTVSYAGDSSLKSAKASIKIKAA